jgi:hypothetical protein
MLHEEVAGKSAVRNEEGESEAKQSSGKGWLNSYVSLNIPHRISVRASAARRFIPKPQPLSNLKKTTVSNPTLV